jgi:hypothetical protein
VIAIQVRATHPEAASDEDERSFIERRESYGDGTVITTAFCEGGTVFLEQHSFSSGDHALIPLRSVEALERLERFLALAKAHVQAHEDARRWREQCLSHHSQPG